jgi:hypothetical protein
VDRVARKDAVIIGLVLLMLIATAYGCTASNNNPVSDPLPQAETIYEAYYYVYRFVDKQYGNVCYAWNESLFCMEVRDESGR